jgi:3-oxoadipate enol-lactonase
MPSIEVNGTTLHVVDEGPRDAPAIVCGHSLFFDHEMFAPLAERLTDRFRVVRYDHRGQGASARAPREQLDMDTLTDDAAALVEALDLAPCVYVGNSMGGFVALRLAARRPDLVSAVVVAGSSADVEEQIDAFDPLVTAMGEGGVEPVLDVVTHIMLGDTSMGGERPELLAATRERLAALGPEIAGPAWQVVHRKAVLDELGDVRVPVLVVAGAEDHAYPPAKSEQAAAAIPGARLEVLDGVGHSVCLEDPDRAAALVADVAQAAVTAA